jgi:hypothetical protein
LEEDGEVTPLITASSLRTAGEAERMAGMSKREVAFLLIGLAAGLILALGWFAFFWQAHP